MYYFFLYSTSWIIRASHGKVLAQTNDYEHYKWDDYEHTKKKIISRAVLNWIITLVGIVDLVQILIK